MRRVLLKFVALFVAVTTQANALDYAPIMGINYDNSQNVAVEVGGVIGKRSNKNWTKGTTGVALSFEPGISGNKLHIGYGGFSGTVASMLGYRATYTLLSMKENYNSYSSEENYSGIELFIGGTIISFQAGYLVGEKTKDGLFNLGVGVGF